MAQETPSTQIAVRFTLPADSTLTAAQVMALLQQEGIHARLEAEGQSRMGIAEATELLKGVSEFGTQFVGLITIATSGVVGFKKLIAAFQQTAQKHGLKDAEVTTPKGQVPVESVSESDIEQMAEFE
jgi:hypothetical protein